MSDCVVGVDVGGTFTDVFVLHTAQKKVTTAKVPSTPKNPSLAFIDGLLAAVDDLSTISTLLHGTTVATNALLGDTT